MPDGGISAFATATTAHNNNRHLHPSNADSSYSNHNNTHIVEHESMMNRTDNADEQNNNTNINDNARRDFFEEIRNGGGHWSQLLRQVILSPPPISRDGSKEDEIQVAEELQNDNIPLQIAGGSENGQFTFIGELNSDINGWIKVGYLQPGDIILDIQGQQVAGYTQADVYSLLYHCIRGNSVALTVAPKGNLGPELRSYLNTRFQKGSVDHALQGVVRDNLYLRTVPVTTRQPRPGEINGVDYTFLAVDEFMDLERNGSLLESGVYAGNHYGTPKPWASHQRPVNNQLGNGEETRSSNQENNKTSGILPGMHPSSEGKRKRNRSNVEALGACDDDDSVFQNANSVNNNSVESSRMTSSDDLGPLPENWEMSYTEKGEVYFIDHNTGTSHWLDPRLSKVKKTALEDCDDNELPFGWEKIEDPHYGTYYIDHVNRRTQFENPVIQAKQNKSDEDTGGENEKESPRMEAPLKNDLPKMRRYNPNPISTPPKPSYANSGNRNSMGRDKMGNHRPTSSAMSSEPQTPTGNYKHEPRSQHRFFTRDPDQLIGERISTVLTKSSRGLGFTIVGGDDDDGYDEFLQIKSVVTDGPAWRDGKLRTGDVLVRVNDVCVLGYTHQEMVSIFQSISPGEQVHLLVCRGYPLPFDPSDPNTEIVTTVAVAPINYDGQEDKRPTTPDSLAHSAHSLPELSTERMGYLKSNTGRPASVDLLLDSPSHDRTKDGDSNKQGGFESGTFLTVRIFKGAAGFGFTITDSVSGQKVKKILDPSHCGGLEEGDRLIAIDGIDLRGVSHTQVVHVLKEFPLGREASLTVQRVHSHSYSKFNSGNFAEMKQKQSPLGMPQRSKTPTADFGKSKPKLRDSLPERSVTPLMESSGSGGYNGQLTMYGEEHQHMVQQLPFNSQKFSSSTLGGENKDHNGVSNDLTQMPVKDWVELTVDLERRQEGFGFRIIGGTEEGSQVSVGHIVPSGAADLDGRLATNDQIISVDHQNVVGASHHTVVQLMARAASAGRVRLVVRRAIYGVPSSTISNPKTSPEGVSSLPIHVTLRRHSSEGFGFVIISSASRAGATIGRIVAGSPADRCRQLRVGDRILGVNHIDISQLHHSQVVQLIKDSGLVLTLSILPTIQDEQPIPQQQMSPRLQSNALASEMENLSLKGSMSFDMGTAFISPESHPLHFEPNNVANISYSDSHIFSVEFNRGERGFGFSIRGGKEFQNMPLFVLRLAENGPAAEDGRMQVGDQILDINGISTQGMTHADAIHLIRTGGSTVSLLLRRGAVPFPYLNQMPNFSFSGGMGSSIGPDENQSLSSSNDQIIGQNSPMYRDQHLSYPR